jgi:hypothetical protein
MGYSAKLQLSEPYKVGEGLASEVVKRQRREYYGVNMQSEASRVALETGKQPATLTLNKHPAYRYAGLGYTLLVCLRHILLINTQPKRKCSPIFVVAARITSAICGRPVQRLMPCSLWAERVPTAY